MNADGSADGVQVQHYMAGGVYVKEALISSGWALEGHKHIYDHLSLLAFGVVQVTVEGVITNYTGPTGILIKANKKHRIEALEDSLWYCTHSVPEGLRLSDVEETLVVAFI